MKMNGSTCLHGQMRNSSAKRDCSQGIRAIIFHNNGIVFSNWKYIRGHSRSVHSVLGARMCNGTIREGIGFWVVIYGSAWTEKNDHGCDDIKHLASKQLPNPWNFLNKSVRLSFFFVSHCISISSPFSDVSVV